ncbi:MAG: hypothetical protein MI864_05045 [Pseudomonadales bacterium]|nr:hypothetical protein [Pseudomonadales bacterium]
MPVALHPPNAFVYVVYYLLNFGYLYSIVSNSEPKLRMDQQIFEIAFEGEIIPGVTLDLVKQNMTKLFKASPAQIEKMFSGKRVVLKSKLDKPTALKYQALLKKNGAVCRIGMIAKQDNVQAPASTPQTATTTDSKQAPSNGKSAVPVSTVSESKSAKKEVSQSSVKNTFEIVKPNPFMDGSAEWPPLREVGNENIQLAGEKVDSILSDLDLNLDAVGIRLSDEVEIVAPEFENLDSMSIAPTGSQLSEENQLPPPPAPDVEHLSIAPAGEDLGELKQEKKALNPDISHLKLS